MHQIESLLLFYYASYPGMPQQKQKTKSIQKTVEGEIVKLKLVREKKVTWRADTVDNSKMNKKKSNVCCIFHREELNEPTPKNKYERE
ncbi:hypothetical protein ECANGB1_1610 [Enterospora canceri]|uniref:Type 1 phosphatases regulator n=1 Tax=Enterospora canceri TaxID=1081671 RepID=A0A1Y1S5Q3_9MICR|nr:hypothetical protein ECANGB1_1610 [Enterospora canceri]